MFAAFLGTIILSSAGWIKVGILNPKEINGKAPNSIKKAPEIGGHLSLLLGACGMPGNTAYFGLLDLCTPKAGNRLFFSCQL
jgi:NADPH-dependent curcumin reductase CurA